jgi:malic enzyme
MTDVTAGAARTNTPADEALHLHRLYRGKIQIAPKCPIHDAGDFSWLYTPGVAQTQPADHRPEGGTETDLRSGPDLD